MPALVAFLGITVVACFRYAEVGDFDNAVRWERKYLEFPNQKTSDIADAQKRLALYLADKPYHEEK